MASEPNSRNYNPENPNYISNSLSNFDDNFGLLKKEDQDIDDLLYNRYDDTLNLQEQLDEYVDEETKLFLNDKIDTDITPRERQFQIRQLKSGSEYKKFMDNLKKTKFYKQIDNKLNSLNDVIDKTQNDYSKRFNNSFLKQRDSRLDKFRKEQEKELNKLNELKYKKKLHEYTIGDFFFSFKDSIFFIINALLSKNYDIKTYTKNYRLLHLGILIVILCIIVMVFKMDSYKK